MLNYKLRHRITLQQQTQTQDAITGESIALWTAFLADEPAEVVPLSGREFIQSAAMQAGVSARITIRYVEGVLPTMRILFDGHLYNIKAILPDPTARRHLTIMAEADVPLIQNEAITVIDGGSPGVDPIGTLDGGSP